MRHLVPQYEMGLGFPPVVVTTASVGRAKRVKSVQPVRRFDELPDEVRYQEWLRDAAFMREVLS